MKIKYFLIVLLYVFFINTLVSEASGSACIYFVNNDWSSEHLPPSSVTFNNVVYHLSYRYNALPYIEEAIDTAHARGCDSSLLTLVIYGNYITEGQNIPSYGNLVCQGDYYNYGSSTFSGSGTFHVTGNFYFNNGSPGLIYLGNSGLHVEGHFYNWGPTNYIVTNGTGSVTFSTHSDVTAPVGTDDGLLPVDINSQPGQVFAVRVDKEPDFPGGIVAPGVQDSIHWLVENLSGATNCTVKFIYPISMVTPDFSIDNAIINHYNIDHWESLITNTSIWSENSNYYESTVTGVSSFSPFMIGLRSGIPILSFWYKIGLGVLLALFGIMMLRKLEIV